MNTNKLRSIIITIVGLFITSCASPQQQVAITPEQMQQRQQIIDLMKQRMALSVQNIQQPTQLATQPAPQQREKLLTEEELATKISNIPELSQGVSFIRQRDGFDYNGQRYLDPEGQIGSFVYNWETGDVTYLVKVNKNEYILKYVRVSSGAEPINIGRVTSNNGNYQLQTVTGKKLSGYQFILSSRGIVMSRGDVAFIYTYGKAIKSFVTPKGWHIALFQNGDVLSTKYVLLERTKTLAEKGDIGDLFSSMADLGNSFGVTEVYDYKLININDTSKEFLINVTLGAKEVNMGGVGCRPTNNKFIRNCDSFKFSESIYQANGSRNRNHYFWSIRWFLTDQGPISIALVGAGKRIAVTDLNTGKKAIAFERLMGINSYDATQNSDGKVDLKVQLGFSSDNIKDLDMWLSNDGVKQGKK